MLASGTASRRGVALALASLAFLAGCGVPPPPASPEVTGSASPAAVDGYLLPTLPAFAEANPICAGVGLSPLTLRGALLGNTARVWAETDGLDLRVLWPRGYRARFTPDLVVVNTVGLEVAREGADMSVGTWPGVLLCPVTSGPSAFVYVLPMPTPSS